MKKCLVAISLLMLAGSITGCDSRARIVERQPQAETAVQADSAATIRVAQCGNEATAHTARVD